MQYKKGVAHIEQELHLQEDKYERLLAEYDARFDALPFEKQIVHLRTEDRVVREELKRLNQLISQFVECRRVGIFLHTEPRIAIKKRTQTVSGPRADVDMREFQNAEKQLQNAEVEYQRLAQRLEQVSNPEYMHDLKERLLALDVRIRKTEKSKKSMEVAQIHREKQIEQVIEDGEPQRLQEINQLRTEYAIAEKKTKELDEVLEKRAETLHDQNAHMTSTKETWKNLAEEATVYGISVEVDVAKTQREKGVAGRVAELQARKAALVKTINLVRTRHSVTLGDYMQKKTAMQKQLTEIAATFQAKNEYPLCKT